MSKKAIWWVIGIVLVAVVFFVAMSGNDEAGDDLGGTDLPDVSEENYNPLTTSNDDFSALDEAVNQLE